MRYLDSFDPFASIALLMKLTLNRIVHDLREIEQLKENNPSNSTVWYRTEYDLFSMYGIMQFILLSTCFVSSLSVPRRRMFQVSFYLQRHFKILKSVEKIEFLQKNGISFWDHSPENTSYWKSSDRYDNPVHLEGVFCYTLRTIQICKNKQTQFVIATSYLFDLKLTLLSGFVRWSGGLLVRTSISSSLLPVGYSSFEY